MTEWRQVPGSDCLMISSEGEVWQRQEVSNATRAKYLAAAFLGPTPAGQCVAWDGVPIASSVRYVPSWTKLTEDQVREIKRRLAAGESQRGIALDYKVTSTLIRLIAIGKRWRDVQP